MAKKKCGMCKKAKTYAYALARWFDAGFPIRPDWQVEELYRVCSSCDEFSKDTCKVCGCPVKPTDRASKGRIVRVWKTLRNKLRMATERCPKGRWEATRMKWRRTHEDHQ